MNFKYLKIGPLDYEIYLNGEYIGNIHRFGEDYILDFVRDDSDLGVSQGASALREFVQINS